jgi:hypothetical protein
MPCLFAVFAGFFPRIADIILWIARPNLFMAPFNGNWFWPAMGIVFVPLTTLFYVVLWSPVTGLVGWDWFWVGLALVMDISNLVGNVRANRNSIPGLATKPVAT